MFARVAPKNRKFVREWLLGIKIDHRYCAVSFKELFARVFGDRRLSAKCIRRSALFSISLWVDLLVAYAMRAANYLPLWLRPLSKVMDFESRPVRTIGYVAAAVAALIVGVITLA
jgi:hypothetical protein